MLKSSKNTLEEISQNMDEIREVVGLSELSSEMKEYESLYLKESVDDLRKMLGIDRMDNWYKEITFKDLARLQFNKASEVIDHMSVGKRIAVLNDLDKDLVFLYGQTKYYGDKIPKDERMTPENFYKIMGKIKHLEILQNWLYGIK